MAGYPSLKKGNQSGEKAKRPLPGVPLDKKSILPLITKHRGNVSKIADSLGCCRQTVRRVIDNDKELKEAHLASRERWIDDIEESVLSRAHKSNDTALQCFVLKTQARHRGWDQDEQRNAATDVAKAAFEFITSKAKPST